MVKLPLIVIKTEQHCKPLPSEGDVSTAVLRK